MSKQINPEIINAFAEIAHSLGATEFTICGNAQEYYANYQVICTCSEEGQQLDPECPEHSDYYDSHTIK